MNKEENRFIEKFSIHIGSSAIGGIPIGDPVITFIINDRVSSTKLEYFREWIETIWQSNGDRNEKSYKAKRNLDMFFSELLSPYIKFPEINIDNVSIKVDKNENY